ncbi:MAG: sigma-70 family RNA polymerase sigma factor [Microbacterium sp.]|uniref:sigma-70 family RNA polymerase sigma factor n=1 Tax=Microbacterium sp. TaxID=51671 RepID=UPI003F9D3B3C
MTDQIDFAVRFEEHRPRLTRIAQRMLGSTADAEDAVQDAWLRASRAGDDGIDNFAGWLTTVTSRVCLNMLRARSSRKESAYDERLPDPIVDTATPEGAPDVAAQLSDAVGIALLLVLDRLSPAERVAFVLHDTFDVPFEQIAELLERSPAAARQLASRARRRVQAAGPGGEADARRQRTVVDAFFAAARVGDFDRLIAVLDPGIVLRTDTGASPTRIVRGPTAVAQNALMFANPQAELAPVVVDGRLGVIVTVDGRAVSLMAFSVLDDHIIGIDAYAGPARLGGIELPVG